MTTIIGKPRNKSVTFDLLEQIFSRFLYDGMKPSGQSLVAAHLDWMRQQSGELRVNCRLETFPETQGTRITLDLNFIAAPPPETPQ